MNIHFPRLRGFNEVFARKVGHPSLADVQPAPSRLASAEGEEREAAMKGEACNVALCKFTISFKVVLCAYSYPRPIGSCTMGTTLVGQSCPFASKM